MTSLPTSRLWHFRARSLKVVDGDTLDVEIDAGFRNRRTERLRLIGVNTPELKGSTREAGLAAKDYVSKWLYTALVQGWQGTGGSTVMEWPLVIQTYLDKDGAVHDDSFGRYLVDVWRSFDGANLNHDLIRNGHAIEDIRTAALRTSLP